MIKNKKGRALIFIIAFIIIFFVACIFVYDKDEITINDSETNIDSIQNKDDVEISKQLNIILGNKNLWYNDNELDKYSYAVTDLDQNGRVEIISSICQGTGMYTYTTVYEVNEAMDSISLCESNLEEYDSQADIIKNSWPVFYDTETQKYYYILEDMTKNGAAEYYENKRYVCLINGKIAEEYLARKNTIYLDAIPEITLTDLSDNEITEEEYNNFENLYFAKFEKMTVNIEWLTNLDEIGVTELESSYKNFKLTK